MRDLIENFLLSEAQTDLVDFSFLVSYASSELGIADRRQLENEVLGAVRDVLASKTVVVGELDDEGGPPLRVAAWDLDPDSALARIAQKWQDGGHAIPSMGEICWFSLTPEGRQMLEYRQQESR